MPQWIDGCAVDDIAREDLRRFDHDGRTFAVYRAPNDAYFCTDGLCSHESVHPADSFVMGDIIECPKHFGQFDYRTGKAVRAPACIDRRVYPVKIENGRVLIGV